MSSLPSAQVPLEIEISNSPPAAQSVKSETRHPVLVRIAHWIVTLSFFALLVSGAEIVISHPRFYWGETGNVLTAPSFRLPIPSSRNLVPTGYGYVLPDQNGWSRALHFQSAWVLVLTGLLYVIWGSVTAHFRWNLFPSRAALSWKSLTAVMLHHTGIERSRDVNDESYNVLQRLSYLSVIFILFPLVIWTGLAMSPAFDSALPATVTLLGGRQSARTMHFLVSIALLLFLFVHIFLVWRTGFWRRVGAMITGHTRHEEER